MLVGPLAAGGRQAFQHGRLGLFQVGRASTRLRRASTGAIAGVVGPVIAYLDRRKLRVWLLQNTSDEPGKSHVGTIKIAKGARLPEERVRCACVSERRIFCSEARPDSADAWSVWRPNPERSFQMFFFGPGR